MENKKKSANKAALWMTYTGGKLHVRYFDKQEPLTAWWKTAQTLKALGVIERCSVFQVADIPKGYSYTV
ncbi:hypothetical protein [Caballeronia grimmiae]|uniref:hypothetical protein n=1 Tax=Caballeronia grimmiae TaxID=1071679 RepID=UPI0038B6CBD4